MTKIEQRVLALLERSPGLFMREICAELETEHDEIRSALQDLYDEMRVKRKRSGAWALIKQPLPIIVEGGGAANIFPRPSWPTSGGWFG